jgi:two-component system, response regulator PdtaR
MSDSNNEQNRALGCLRLASELRQPSRETLNPNSKAHCLRTAGDWADQVVLRLTDDAAPQTYFVDVVDAVADRPAPVILIVEDDPFLRMLAVEVVEEAGFETLEAGDADQAIAILESRSEIAVLFTDINMPGSMDGLELALVVSKRWPAIEILVASGHVRLRQGDLPPNGRFLGKPYHAAAMIAELHSLVSQAA